MLCSFALFALAGRRDVRSAQVALQLLTVSLKPIQLQHDVLHLLRQRDLLVLQSLLNFGLDDLRHLLHALLEFFDHLGHCVRVRLTPRETGTLVDPAVQR